MSSTDCNMSNVRKSVIVSSISLVGVGACLTFVSIAYFTTYWHVLDYDGHEKALHVGLNTMCFSNGVSGAAAGTCREVAFVDVNEVVHSQTCHLKAQHIRDNFRHLRNVAFSALILACIAEGGFLVMFGLSFVNHRLRFGVNIGSCAICFVAGVLAVVTVFVRSAEGPCYDVCLTIARHPQSSSCTSEFGFSYQLMQAGGHRYGRSWIFWWRHGPRPLQSIQAGRSATCCPGQRCCGCGSSASGKL